MNYAALLKAINTATAQFQGRAAMAVNQALVLRNWLVGAWILEFEQHGKDRAKYGERLLESLAKDISVSGLELRNLQNCRLLYATYPQIRQTVSAEFKVPLRLPIRGTLSPEFMDGTPSGKDAATAPIGHTVCRIAHSALAHGPQPAILESFPRTDRHRRPLEARLF
jgi:hypothetical protein